jgi:hypothetical protein
VCVISNPGPGPAGPPGESVWPGRPGTGGSLLSGGGLAPFQVGPEGFGPAGIALGLFRGRGLLVHILQLNGLFMREGLG